MAQALTDGDPRRLGAFEILGRLGEGGQGVVYLGRSGTGEPVAIKLLHARFSADADARARFLREASVAQRVARFCTASVLHADLAGNQPYIVSEYVPGPSLRQLVDRDGPRRGAPLDRLAVSTATALAAIHRAGILHRDFKPANVLMGPEGPVVIDFGIAKALDTPGATATGGTLGTPSYLAPEQLSGAAVTPAVDVFAWGVTIVFAATGRPAFGSDSIPVVINRILHEQPDLTALDDSLRGLVAACLSKDPARRPSAEQLVTHLMGRPVTPSAEQAGSAPNGPGQAPRRRPWAGRTAALATAAGITAAALTAGTVVLAQSVRTSGQDSAAQQSLPPSAKGTMDVPAPPISSTPRASRTPKRRLVSPTPSSAAPSLRPATPPAPSRTPAPTPTRRASAEPTRTPAPTPTPTRTPAPTATPVPTPTPTPSASASASASASPSPAAKPNPHTAAGVCGSGYKVIDRHSLGGATVFLLYSDAAGKNCVITLSTYVVPQKIKMSAVLQVKNGPSGDNTGDFTVYAGPLRLSAEKTCVIWGGGYGTASWKSAWSHCG